MTPYQPLLDHILKRVELNEDEIQTIISCFKLTKIKKRQFIIQPDFVAKYRNYVVEGAFRAYVVADEGEEHTIQFAIEDWWISDYSSFIFQRPASMFVVAFRLSSNDSVASVDFLKEYVAYSSFFIGLVLCAFNFLQIPFWVGWNLYLVNANRIVLTRQLQHFYLLGIIIGTFLGMLLAIVVLDSLAQKNFSFTSYILPVFIPIFFVVLAIFQIKKVYQKYLK